jgi:hypothetical protein
MKMAYFPPLATAAWAAAGWVGCGAPGFYGERRGGAQENLQAPQDALPKLSAGRPRQEMSIPWQAWWIPSSIVREIVLYASGSCGDIIEDVYVRRAVSVVVLSAAMFAQSAPPSCPSDRPVDEIITEIHKQQSNKKHRNVNPLPNVFCIGGWCRSHTGKQKTPDVPESAPQTPESAPRGKAPQENESASSSSSSSASAADKCDEAMEMALKAAHDVEVGDYSYSINNYEGALLRYKVALEEKPGDTAIHVRLGRVFEKLNQLPQALEQYKAAQELTEPAHWSDEAKASVLRLEHRQSSGKD